MEEERRRKKEEEGKGYKRSAQIRRVLRSEQRSIVLRTWRPYRSFTAPPPFHAPLPRPPVIDLPGG